MLFVIAVSCIRNMRERKRKLRERIEKLWGELPDREYRDGDLEAISHYFRNRKKDGFQIDDITWNDLDLDRLFVQMNHTWTSAGEEYLYQTLRTPSFSQEELAHRDALADYFASHKEERENLQLLLAQIGRTKRLSISDYLDRVTGLSTESSILHYLCIFLLLASLVLIFVVPSAGVFALILVVAFNILTYYRDKAKVEPYFICLEYLARMVRFGEKIAVLPAGDCTELQEEYDRLERLTARLVKVRRGVGMLKTTSGMGGNPMQIVEDYLMILLHLDLLRFNSLLCVVQENRSAVYGLLEQIGRLELALATASYREMMPLTAVPELRSDNRPHLRAEKLYHPLIAEPVANSIAVDRPVLLTGSNASGKSTFLKTAAVNAILAQSIHTVLAERYEGPFCRVLSSMALRDSIVSGESYYIVEIKSLKRIMQAAEEKPLVFCFVDEVLRGTNTVERIAASSQILKSLAEKGALCFAATHDIELTDLLQGEYANYHFEEEVHDGDVWFSYQLLPGKATTRNAIRLLSVMGYKDSVIQAAEESARHFAQTGEWRMQ